MEHQTNVPDWKQRLSAELRRDKKKTAMLAILMVVGGVLGGRLLIGRMAPASALAGVPASAVTAPLPAAKSVGSVGEDLTRETKRNQYIQSIQCNAMRDLFTPNPEYYPEETPVTTRVKETPATQESAERVRAAEQRTVKAQAKTLNLQSIMLSSWPTAIINGKVLRKGDWISGFQVMEISADACMVQKNGFTLVLEMSSNDKGRKSDSGSDGAN